VATMEPCAILSKHHTWDWAGGSTSACDHWRNPLKANGDQMELLSVCISKARTLACLV
jgi:hypothetical protein